MATQSEERSALNHDKILRYPFVIDSSNTVPRIPLISEETFFNYSHTIILMILLELSYSYPFQTAVY